jgi:Reverse transcriptase (RNA-dependent DNA polymerase)/RNase H-like domain found in reverse transcriptase
MPNNTNLEHEKTETHMRNTNTTQPNNNNTGRITYEIDTETKELHIRILAASAATQEEVDDAKQRKDDGSKPVITEKRPYRPKPTSQYEEPAYLPDDDDTLEVLYRNGGVAISKVKTEVSAREPESIITYDEKLHAETLRKSLQWDDCPTALRPPIEELIKKYWDVFAPEGLKHHIRGFVCHIDTGNAQPVCCALPRYGPHEARVITQLARGLEENGLIEEARSPWGAQVVLAAKPNQDHVHWSEYVWRLTVSYRKLNAVTRPYIYPSRRCDDAARDIGRSKHFITMDFESGFWQVLLHETSRDKTAFFVPGGQKRWTVMPMGCLNAHGTFCCLVDTLKRQWNAKATELGIRDDIEVTLKGERPWTDAEVIVDDIMLHSENTEPLIQYFEIVLQVLQRHQVTVKLKKCRFFPQSAEFVGMDIEADGNRPARSKMQALEDLKDQPPNTVTDLRHLIGLIGFYQDWIANYELRIGGWRQYIKTLRGTKSTESEMNLETEWKSTDTELLNTLLDELITRPTLARPDYTRRFYLKTDWCRLGMAAVLLQADPEDNIAKESERQETEDATACAFDKHMHIMRLRPIAFSSRKCTETESAMHSYTGEAATGVWAIEKYKRHVFGKEFTWMTDCNGLRQFFDGEDVPTHMHQRMRQRLLRFHFTIVHRPARFMVECDVLTRYNSITSQWRPAETTKPIIETPIATTSQPIQTTQPSTLLRTLLAAKSTNERNIWIFNAGATNVVTATTEAGINANFRHIEERTEWNRHPFDKERLDADLVTIDQLEAIIQPAEQVDWIIAHDGCDCDNNTETEAQFKQLTRLIQMGEQHGNSAILIFTRPTASIYEHSSEEYQSIIAMRIQQLEASKWNILRATVKAHRYGAAVATQFTMIVALRNLHTLRTFHLQNSEATPLSDIIDQNNSPETTPAEEIRAMQRPTQRNDRNEPQVAAMIQRKGQETNVSEWITAWTPCFSKDHPGPDLHDTTTQWYESPFAIETTNPDNTSTVRGIRHHELVEIIGYDENTRYRMLQLPPETALTQMRTTPPKQLITAALSGLQQAEDKTIIKHTVTGEPATCDDTDGIDDELRLALTNMLAHEFQQTTTIPLPTTAQWQDATSTDWDLNKIVNASQNGGEIQRDEIQNATLYKLWTQGTLEVEDGIVYHTGTGASIN